MIVLSKRGRALKVGKNEDTDMFAQILNIKRLTSLVPDLGKLKLPINSNQLNDSDSFDSSSFTSSDAE